MVVAGWAALVARAERAVSLAPLAPLAPLVTQAQPVPQAQQGQPVQRARQGHPLDSVGPCDLGHRNHQIISSEECRHILREVLI